MNTNRPSESLNDTTRAKARVARIPVDWAPGSVADFEATVSSTYPEFEGRLLNLLGPNSQIVDYDPATRVATIEGAISDENENFPFEPDLIVVKVKNEGVRSQDDRG